MQELKKDYYQGSPFFSDSMLYARWGPEEEASGFMEHVVMPAFQGDEAMAHCQCLAQVTVAFGRLRIIRFVEPEPSTFVSFIKARALCKQ